MCWFLVIYFTSVVATFNRLLFVCNNIPVEANCSLHHCTVVLRSMLVSWFGFVSWLPIHQFHLNWCLILINSTSAVSYIKWYTCCSSADRLRHRGFTEKCNFGPSVWHHFDIFYVFFIYDFVRRIILLLLGFVNK